MDKAAELKEAVREEGLALALREARQIGDVKSAIRTARGKQDDWESNTSPFVVLQSGDGGEHVRSLDELMMDTPPPRRIQREIKLHDAESLIRYIAEFGREETRLYADAEDEPPCIVARIDDHRATDAPAREEHTATLPLPFSPEWTAWASMEQQGLTDQTTFAEFLKDNRLHIRNPAPDELLKIVLQLRIKSDVAYTEVRNLQSGELELHYSEAFKGGGEAPGKLKIPETMRVEIPVFRGTDPVKIDIELRYRLREGQMKWYVRIFGKDELYRHAFRAVAERVQEKSGRQLYYGA